MHGIACSQVTVGCVADGPTVAGAPRAVSKSLLLLWLTGPLIVTGGCGPNYRQLRLEGQRAMLGNAPGAARVFFQQAEQKRPRHVENLYDLGTCSIMIAKERFAQRNPLAAQGELDAAITYLSEALEVHPGHLPSREAKNVALELQGQFDAALKQAEWGAEFVGPSAKQYLFLARELEERGQISESLMRYKQAVVVEPTNASAHKEFAQFLLRHRNEPAAVHHLLASYRLNPHDEWVADRLAERGVLPAVAEMRRAGDPADASAP